MTKSCIVCKKQPVPGDNTRSFHVFPQENGRRQKWFDAIRVSSVSKNARICSDHFDSNSFHQTDGYTTIRRILPNAVPFIKRSPKSIVDEVTPNTENLFQSSEISSHNLTCNVTADECVDDMPFEIVENGRHNSEIDCSVKENNHDRVLMTDTSPKSSQNEERLLISNNKTQTLKRTHETENYERSKKFRFMDGFKTSHITRADFVSDEAWHRFTKFTKYKNLQIKTGRKKYERKDKKLGSFKELIKNLKEKETSGAVEYLEGLPVHVQELITRMKTKKPTSPFPSHLKNFARTLHFHSPAAYEMVRRSFLKCLPCVETLNTWSASTNFKPGVCEEIMEYVSKVVIQELNKGRKLVFNITFDEMSIKQWVFYCKNSHEWKGLIDLGGQFEKADEKGNIPKASKALVFMLVNINGRFKTPVAYYFTNSLTGEVKTLLLKDLLVKLHDKSINVYTVTFDGDDSNQKACKFLGANFDYTDKQNFKPFFSHPVTFEPIFVFFDPCHMM